MIIVNTTFILHNDIIPEVLKWIEEAYKASAVKSGCKADSAMLTKVLGHSEPDVTTYALHIPFDNNESAKKWAEGVGSSLRRILSKRWGERALTFVTLLEVIK